MCRIKTQYFTNAFKSYLNHYRTKLGTSLISNACCYNDSIMIIAFSILSQTDARLIQEDTKMETEPVTEPVKLKTHLSMIAMISISPWFYDYQDCHNHSPSVDMVDISVLWMNNASKATSLNSTTQTTVIFLKQRKLILLINGSHNIGKRTLCG